jgi:renalase
MATRPVGQGLADHGAQFFTVRDPKFQQAVERWQEAGWGEPWFQEGEHIRYRAAQGMNALAGRLAESLEIRCGKRVQRVEAGGGSWSIITHCGERIMPALSWSPCPRLRRRYCPECASRCRKL